MYIKHESDSAELFAKADWSVVFDPTSGSAELKESDAY